MSQDTKKVYRNEDRERNLNMITDFRSGMSYVELIRKYGVTVQRMSQIELNYIARGIVSPREQVE